MARHSGLNDISRRGRIATHYQQSDLDDFNQQVEPQLREYYAELLASGKAPFKSTYDDAMGWVRMRTREAGNIIRSDERAFIYPVLSDAYRAGGVEELRRTFDDLVKIYNQSHDNFVESVQQKLDTLVETHRQIDTLITQSQQTASPIKAFMNLIEKKVTGKLSEEFNRNQKIDALVAKTTTDYADVINVKVDYWGRCAFYPHQYGYNHNASPEDIRALSDQHKNASLTTKPLNQPAAKQQSQRSFPTYLVKR